MANNYVEPGMTMTWTNGTGSAVVSGQVVKAGNILGVAWSISRQPQAVASPSPGSTRSRKCLAPLSLKARA